VTLNYSLGFELSQCDTPPLPEGMIEMLELVLEGTLSVGKCSLQGASLGGVAMIGSLGGVSLFEFLMSKLGIENIPF
jgi:hypothetical protein